MSGKHDQGDAERAPDELAHFLAEAHHNEKGVPLVFPREWAQLVELNDIWRLLNRLPIPGGGVEEAALRGRAHASFLVGVRLAASGMNADVAGPARAAVEAALYALHIKVGRDTRDAWLQRHDSPEGRARSRTAFRASEVFGTLRDVAPDLEGAVRDLYGHTIDFGAHPNVAYVVDNLAGPVAGESGTTNLHTEILMPGGAKHQRALGFTAHAGLAALSILRNVWPQLYAESGVEERLRRLMQAEGDSGDAEGEVGSGQ